MSPKGTAAAVSFSCLNLALLTLALLTLYLKSWLSRTLERGSLLYKGRFTHTQSDNYIMRLFYFDQDRSAIYEAMHAIHVTNLHL